MSCVINQPLSSLFLPLEASVGNERRYTHLLFAQKLTVYAAHLVQRALVMGVYSREAEGKEEKSSIGAEVASIRPPSCITRTSIEIL